MNKSNIQNQLSDLISVIKYTLDSKKHLPALILIYSAIDILSWLNRPASKSDVSKSDFIDWVDRYLLPNSKLLCSSVDLYGARCGLVHSYQAESKLSRDGKAKQLWYAWGTGDVTKLTNKIQQAKLDEIAVAISVDDLVNALEQGISKFQSSLDADFAHAKTVYERAEKKFFSNIPKEML